MLKKQQSKVNEGGRYNIRVLDRAIRLLGLLSNGETWKLAEISDALDISSSTVYRLLSNLSGHNYVNREDTTGGYRLGIACLELSRAFSERSDIRRMALPELENLRDQTAETVHLGVLDQMEVVYLEKLHGLHAIGLMSSRVGGRAPAYCTGVGKALLAFTEHQAVRDYYSKNGLSAYTAKTITNEDDFISHLEQIKAQGYSLDEGEHEVDVRCIAAPLFDVSGMLVAAISISGPAGRFDSLKNKPDLINKTVAAARNISRSLGYVDRVIDKGYK